ncbi:MAG: porin [Opitutae bacterium]|nr:porin [Opitutae bacterium]
MKAYNPLTAVLALMLGAATAYSQVELTDNLAISGFVDAAYTSSDDGTTDTEKLDLEGAEVDLLFNLDTVSGEVHLQTDGGTLELEQAFVTYDLGNGLAVTAGRYLSLLGFEADETVTRYTRSRAYDLTSVIPLYNEGVKLEAVSDKGWLAVSLQNEVWSGFGPGNINGDAIGLEVQAGFTGQQGLTAVIGYAGQDTEGSANPNGEIYNIWVSYESGPLILAAEYNDFANAGEKDKTGDSVMVLGRYAINENSSITGRYSEENLDDGRGAEKWSVAPQYSFTDNLAGRIEYSRTDYVGTGVDEVDFFALEAMFTF